MLIGGNTTGWPVPGIQFDGRQLFIQVKDGDKEDTLAKFSALTCVALKLFADLRKAPPTNHHRLEVVEHWMKIWDSTGIKATHEVEPNYDQLLKRNLDG
jgi:hypothetical protein